MQTDPEPYEPFTEEQWLELCDTCEHPRHEHMFGEDGCWHRNDNGDETVYLKQYCGCKRFSRSFEAVA